MSRTPDNPWRPDAWLSLGLLIAVGLGPEAAHAQRDADLEPGSRVLALADGVYVAATLVERSGGEALVVYAPDYEDESTQRVPADQLVPDTIAAGTCLSARIENRTRSVCVRRRLGFALLVEGEGMVQRWITLDRVWLTTAPSEEARPYVPHRTGRVGSEVLVDRGGLGVLYPAMLVDERDDGSVEVVYGDGEQGSAPPAWVFPALGDGLPVRDYGVVGERRGRAVRVHDGDTASWVGLLALTVSADALPRTATSVRLMSVQAPAQIGLEPGQALLATTCGLPGANAEGARLTVLDEYDEEVAVGRDACGGAGSAVVFVSREDAFYQLRATCESGGCSGFVGYIVVEQEEYLGRTPDLMGDARDVAAPVAALIPGRAVGVFRLARGDRITTGGCAAHESHVFGDVQLRLETDSGEEIAPRVGPCGVNGWSRTWEVPASTSYQLMAACNGDEACGGLLALRVTIAAAGSSSGRTLGAPRADATARGVLTVLGDGSVLSRHLEPDQAIEVSTCGAESPTAIGEPALTLIGPDGEMPTVEWPGPLGCARWTARARAPGEYTVRSRCPESIGCAGRLAWRVHETTSGTLPFYRDEPLARFQLAVGDRVVAGSCRGHDSEQLVGAEVRLLGPDGTEVATSEYGTDEPGRDCVYGGRLIWTATEAGEHTLEGFCEDSPCGGRVAYHSLSETPVTVTLPPPRRRPPWFSLELVGRGLLGVDPVGGGGLFDLRAAVWLGDYFVLRAGGSLGLGGGPLGGILAGSVWTTISFDVGRILEIGGGIGYGTLNDDQGDGDTRFSAVVRMRVGAPGTFEIDTQAHMSAANDQVILMRLEAIARLRLDDIHLGLRGYGGLDGLALGEAVFYWMPGPVGIRVSAGAAGVFYEPRCAGCGPGWYGRSDRRSWDRVAGRVTSTAGLASDRPQGATHAIPPLGWSSVPIRVTSPLTVTR